MFVFEGWGMRTYMIYRPSVPGHRCGVWGMQLGISAAVLHRDVSMASRSDCPIWSLQHFKVLRFSCFRFLLQASMARRRGQKRRTVGTSSAHGGKSGSGSSGWEKAFSVGSSLCVWVMRRQRRPCSTFASVTKRERARLQKAAISRNVRGLRSKVTSG